MGNFLKGVSDLVRLAPLAGRKGVHARWEAEDSITDL